MRRFWEEGRTSRWDALDLASAKRNRIRENLFFAFLYNIIAIPVAALGFLNPMSLAGAMTPSSIRVVTNSLRMRVSDSAT